MVSGVCPKLWKEDGRCDVTDVVAFEFVGGYDVVWDASCLT